MLDKSELMEQVLDRYGIQFRASHNGNQTVHCPNPDGHVHGDRNPSASVNLAKGLFICHGCDLRGDGYNLIMQIEGLTFLEAKEQVGEVYVPTESDFIL